MKKNENKNAICIRNNSSWGNVKAEYKFDSPSFNPTKVLNRLPILSPKMNELIKKIEELDKKDLDENNKLFKHIIYSDVAGVYGAKMIASVLLSNGFKLAYNNNYKIVNKSSNTFALLTTSTVYKKPLTVGLKKNLFTP